MPRSSHQPPHISASCTQRSRLGSSYHHARARHLAARLLGKGYSLVFQGVLSVSIASSPRYAHPPIHVVGRELGFSAARSRDESQAGGLNTTQRVSVRFTFDS